MEEVKYIPGDLVMTNGVPLGTAKDVVYLVSNLRCKGSDYFDNNNNNKVNKVKTIFYLDFI